MTEQDDRSIMPDDHVRLLLATTNPTSFTFVGTRNIGQPSIKVNQLPRNMTSVADSDDILAVVARRRHRSFRPIAMSRLSLYIMICHCRSSARVIASDGYQEARVTGEGHCGQTTEHGSDYDP